MSSCLNTLASGKRPSMPDTPNSLTFCRSIFLLAHCLVSKKASVEHSPTAQKGLEISGGGGYQRPKKKIKKCMEFKWQFRSIYPFHGGNKDILWNYTMLHDNKITASAISNACYSKIYLIYLHLSILLFSDV